MDISSLLTGGSPLLWSPSTPTHTLDHPFPEAPGPDPDLFGSAVSLSPSFSAVGAWGVGIDGSGDGGGAVYVFNNSTGALVHNIPNPNDFELYSNDHFGHSVGITDAYIVIGCPWEDEFLSSDPGMVFVYDAITGSQLHAINAPGGSGDEFGKDVDTAGDLFVAGQWLDGKGRAYIFSNVTGNEIHEFINPGSENEFGRRVGMSESFSIVSGWLEGSSSGKAYIYNNSTGSLLHTLDNPNAYGATAGDQFGSSVGICESFSIVGAWHEDDAGGTDSGKAYIFDNSTGSLIHTLDNPTPYGTSAGDFFGSSVEISESFAIVGAYGEDDAGGAESGKAYIFSTATGKLLSILDNQNAYDTAAGDWFGAAVDITETHSIVGAPQEDDATAPSSGKAYILS